MTKDEHIKYHQELHGSLERLITDFVKHTGRFLETVTLLDFINWSSQQRTNPEYIKGRNKHGRRR